MKNLLIVLVLISFLSIAAQAQSFSSGSTGADGALDLSQLSCTTCQIQLPPSGIFNFTTVNIPGNKSLTFKRNLRNTPVVILAQGNVTIAGNINVSLGTDPDQIPTLRTPGPGGFYGGASGQPGFGPGSGQVSVNNFNARWIGPLSLVPIIGGSGGAGINSNGGNGGSGAVVIASSTSIAIINTGSIHANSGCTSGPGGCGAWRSNTSCSTFFSIAGVLQAVSGSGSFGQGLIRLEAPANAITFTGSSFPQAVISAINPTIVSSTTPNLTIVSIGGFPVPANSGQRFDTADVLLPNSLSDPINVVVQASNIPVGTQVHVTFGTSNGGSYSPGTLSGTEASSTATATVSNLVRTQVTYLFVHATFNLPPSLTKTAANHKSRGRDEVAKVRIEAAPGASPRYVFLRRDGSVIDSKKVPREILQHLGL